MIHPLINAGLGWISDRVIQAIEARFKSKFEATSTDFLFRRTMVLNLEKKLAKTRASLVSEGPKGGDLYSELPP